MAVDTTLIEKEPRAEPEGAYKAVNPNHPRLAIKHGKSFLLMDTSGFLPGGEEQGYGLYCDDTRFLSKWDVRLNGHRLFLLSGTTDDGFAASFTYTNHGIPGIQDQSLRITRSPVINGVFADSLVVENFGAGAVELELALEFAADFIDMFEVRGARRPRRGRTHSARVEKRRSRVTLSYTGLDGVLRKSAITFRGATPDRLTAGSAHFSLRLAPRSSAVIESTVSIDADDSKRRRRRVRPHAAEKKAAYEAYRRWLKAGVRIETENAEFNTVLERALNDVYVLLQETPAGFAIAAGVPWFAQPFGRDGAITGSQTIIFNPAIAREEVTVLGAYQGTEYDIVTAQAPGKILHEMRFGEMARMKEIAFRPYYGTVDATQLWLMLLAEYIDWTGDVALLNKLGDTVWSAVSFLLQATDGGYITYGGVAGEALTNQGWKDSFNSIVYSDGSLAKAPIAVCEAQGYLYAALSRMAGIYQKIGRSELANLLEERAERIKNDFRRDFWMADKQFVALALDGDGRRCEVISSNPGHLLGTGILSPEQERLVAARLMQPDMFSGWGIRTLSSLEAAYQPMDYQVGSVWPHDNAFAVEGMLKLGMDSDAHRVMLALFDVARNLEDKRLPELFAGFERDGARTPVPYPVACVPQAWSAGCVLHMLKACFGIAPAALNKLVRIVNPSLPGWLGTVTVRNLTVAGGRVDLQFVPGKDGKTKVNVLRKSRGIEVQVEYR